MKSLITYYSFSGNTDRIAKIFGKILEAKGEVDIQRLKLKDEVKTFIGQCAAARRGEKPELEGNVKYDAASYDLVLVGSPVWALVPTPAVNTFLDKVSGLNGKRVVALLTSGSGLGVGSCFKNIRKALEAKGVARIDEINIPDRKNRDGDFVTSSLQKIL
ncbi:MAG: NAD(P)H-dependent oxidoreductase [Candidatus Omnitrophica bacterium]|nr:NAD(P)H-dependent oxidoreductase [Candidatus Omnitrophota bacterium]